VRDRWCSGLRVCRLDDFGQPPSPRYRSGRAPTEWHLVHTTGIRCSMDFHPAYPELRQRNRWHRPSAIAAGLAAITSLVVTLATRDLRPSLPAQPDRISVRWLVRLPSTSGDSGALRAVRVRQSSLCPSVACCRSSKTRSPGWKDAAWGARRSGMGQSSAFVDRRRIGRSAPIPDHPSLTTERKGSNLCRHSMINPNIFRRE